MVKIILSLLSLAALVCGIIYSQAPRTRNTIAHIGRIFSGLVFIFSGTVKLVDPLGTTYKNEDYFAAFGLDFLEPYAFLFALIMILGEFVIGMALLFNMKTKLASWGVLMFMVVFTPLTLFLAIYNPVHDCGCFGDALVITNWQTFWKNIVIDVFVIMLFLSRTQIKSKANCLLQWVAVSSFTGIGLFIALDSYYHLPQLDFRPWKIGNRLAVENPLPKEYFITYKNKHSGQFRDFNTKYMLHDTSAYSKAPSDWSFIAQKVVDPNEKIDHGLMIVNEAGDDVTEQVLAMQGAQLLIFSHDLSSAQTRHMQHLTQLARSATEDGMPVRLITSSERKTIDAFIVKHHLSAEILYSDDTAIKAVIRSNPGIVLVNNAVILGKWHINDTPLYESLRQLIK